MLTASTMNSRSTTPNRWLDSLLGLCFCNHCVDGAARAGIDAGRLKTQVAGDIGSYLASDVDFPPDMAEAFWLADTRANRDLQAFPRLALDRRDLAGR